MAQPAGSLWPPVPDFNSMLQNPKIGFSDAELKACVIERDDNNQPRPRAGNFAVCYKGIGAATGQNVCIRLFARKSEERRDRYAKISAHLKANPLDCLVKFEYLEKGIRHPDPARYGGDTWYPIVRMDWIEGSILFDWLREKCRANDARAIAHAAEQWVELAQQLESVGIAHGDLQHANVMVTPTGILKLVDYDCMCVPDLVGVRNLELGVEPYQHPDRNEETKLFPGLDRFSELFILVVLRALAASPQLWFEHIEPPPGAGEPYDKLLFRKSDFDSPQSSRVYSDLLRSSDPEVARLTKELFQLGKVPLNSIPPLSTFVFDFDAVRELFRKKAWDEAVEQVDRCRGGKMPPDLVAETTRGRERIQCRLNLERALESGDEAAVQTAYKPQLLDDYPRASASVQAAKLATKVQAILGKLESASRSGNWRQFVAIWDSERGLVEQRKSCQRYRDAAEDWRIRNGFCDELRRLQKASPIDASSLGLACEELLSRGGHPEIDSEIPGIQRLVERWKAFESFRRVPHVPSDVNDRALVAAWDELLFAGWQEAEQQRSRLNEAITRLRAVKSIREAIATADAAPAIANEKAIKKLAAGIPTGYEVEKAVRTRLTIAESRLAVCDHLQKALSNPPLSEKVLAQCWKKLGDLNAGGLLSAAVRARLELSTKRLPVLQKLAAIDLQGPVDVVDAAVRGAWDERLLNDCPDATPWKQHIVDATRRVDLLARLDQAIAAEDHGTVVVLLEEPLLRGYPFAQSTTSQIRGAIKKTEQTRVLIDALRNRRDADFCKHFDQKVVKANSVMFEDFQTQIGEILRKEILPLKNVGLAKPLVGRSIEPVQGNSNRYQVSWTWPSPRLTDQCILGVCQSTPNGQVDPATAAIHRIPIDRNRWQTGGGIYSLTARSEWLEKRAEIVAVWAVIDLGFSMFYSEPLILGRVTHQDSAARRE